MSTSLTLSLPVQDGGWGEGVNQVQRRGYEYGVFTFFLHASFTFHLAFSMFSYILLAQETYLSHFLGPICSLPNLLENTLQFPAG